MDEAKLKELEKFINDANLIRPFLAILPCPSSATISKATAPSLSLGAKLPSSAYSHVAGDFKSKSYVVEESDEEMADRGEKLNVEEAEEEEQEEEDEIMESDIELEGDTVEPDNDPPRKMADPSVEVTDESREPSQLAKAKAMDAISERKLEEAIEHLTQAILLNPTSAIMYATRASVYIKMKKPNAAIRDATAALEINPDSAKGYKSRSIARAMLGQWEDAAKDLHLASTLDYDEEINSVLKKVEPNAHRMEEHRRKYDRLRKEREDRKIERERRRRRAQAQAAYEKAKKQEQSSSSRKPGGMPGRFPGGMAAGFPGSMPGGMPGNIDFSKILNIGTKVWRYYDFGPKAVPPLICLPGIAGKADVYYKQIMSLSIKGYRVISVDIPCVWNHKEWIQSFEKFWDAIGVHHIHLYGTSLGGFLAQLFVQHRPRRVKSLVLSNTFLETRSFAAAMPWAPIVGWTPSFLLKRHVLTGIRDGPHEPFIADSVDLVVSHVETLSRDDLASRLTLTVGTASVEHLLLSDSFINMMDTNDYSAIPQQLKDQLDERYPGARGAYLKTGGDFPFLSRPDEVNLHLQLHLRRVGLEAKPELVRRIPKDGTGGGGSPSKENNDRKDRDGDKPKDNRGNPEST